MSGVRMTNDKVAQIQVRILGFFFLVGLVLSGYLSFSVHDSTRVVQQIEAEVGHSLSCIEAYDQREINDYFYPQHRSRGEVIYFFSMFAPFWLLGFGVLSIRLSVVWQRKYIRWLPAILMSIVVLYLLFSGPTIRIMNCALE